MPKSDGFTECAVASYSSVYPSAGARATAWAATVPAAPGRFSTAKDCPRRSESLAKRMRHTTSAVPPGL